MLSREQQVMDVLTQAFHIFYTFMGKFEQAWKESRHRGDVHPGPQSTQAVGVRPDLVRTTRQPCHPQVGVSCYMKKKGHDMLSPIPHILWVHGQGLTRLGYSRYTSRITIIQASHHPSCGSTRSDENYKTTKPSSGLSMLLSKEPHTMNISKRILYIFRYMGKV